MRKPYFGKKKKSKPLERRPTPAEITRFMKFVKLDAKTKCWEWQGGKDTDGYGQFWWNGKARWSARFSLQVFRGMLKIGDEADHMCMNPGCVNPGHLQPLSKSVNSGRKLRDKKMAEYVFVDDGVAPF